MISGAVTAVLLLAFLGIAGWAYSARTRARFDDAAQLPLRDELSDVECRMPNERQGCCGCDKSAIDTRQSEMP